MFCLNCGKELPEGANCCPVCGTPADKTIPKNVPVTAGVQVGVAVPVADAAPVENTAPVANDNAAQNAPPITSIAMFCENCGKMLEEGTKFCSGCGKPVKASGSAPGAQAYGASGNTAPNNNTQGYAATNNGAPNNGTQNYAAPNNGAGGNTGYGYAGNNSANFGSTQPYGYQYAPTPETPLTRLSAKVKTNAIIWIVIASLQSVIAIVNLIVWSVYHSSYLVEASSNGISALVLAIIAIVNFVSAKKDLDYSKYILHTPRGIVAKFQPIGGYIGNLIYNLIFGGIIGIVGSIYGLCVRSYVMNYAGYFQMIEKQDIEKEHNGSH